MLGCPPAGVAGGGWVTPRSPPVTIKVMRGAARQPRQVSNGDLVLQARSDDRVAFAIVFERHRPLAATLVGRFVTAVTTRTTCCRRPPSKRWSAWAAYGTRPGLGPSYAGSR